MDAETGIDERLLRALLVEKDQGMRRLIVALLGLDDRLAPSGDDQDWPPAPPSD
jgi:hypothetical protein